MTQPSRIHLFQGYGVELEYMIVDRDSLAVKPIADELLKHELGVYGSDFEAEMVTWSNELVLHLIEIKATKPEANLNALENAFADQVTRINSILEKWNAQLMPSAAHPFMDPFTETKLWPHDSNEIYDTYNKIFDCRGHGWSNAQASHLNLPFYDDEEFTKLHAAVRVVLPILPALCASSPIIDGKLTGYQDTRLTYYKKNQAKIPSISGKVIPEAIFSKRQYLNTIYEKIKTDIAPYDPDNILNPIWVNSRGAIPRFDRGSIEIRLMDVQECPSADLAICALVIETIKLLVAEKMVNLEEQMRLKTEILAGILDDTTQFGRQANIYSSEYFHTFGLTQFSTAGEIWAKIFSLLIESGNQAVKNYEHELKTILRGTLSDRMIQSIGADISPEAIKGLYKKLVDCLAQNKLLIP